METNEAMHARCRRRKAVFPIALLVLVFCSIARGEQTVRPNILVIFTDDQGMADVGCYGSEIPTPNIDSLARDGMKLNQFYAASSICTPSRFGLFTGRFAQRSRDQLTGALMFLADYDSDRGIRTGEDTYVSALKQSGYSTHLIGKWHLGHGHTKFWPTQHGFDSFFGHTGGCVDFFTCHYANRPDWYRGTTLVDTDAYATDVITDETEKQIRSLGKPNEPGGTRQPWYIHVAYNAPHFGKAWDPKSQQPKNIMQPKPSDLARVADIRDPLRRAFAAKVVGLDEGVGRILRALDESDQRANTLVIFMTDHGGDPKYGGSNEPFRGGKATLFDGGIRVPCLVRLPGTVPAGSQSDSVSSAIDWFPTLMALCNVKTPHDHLDGQNILPLLRGEQPSPHRAIAWSTGSHAELGRKDWHAVRDENWKWVAPPGQSEMLFDLSKDPAESNDLAQTHPEIVARLRAFSMSTRPPGDN